MDTKTQRTLAKLALQCGVDLQKDQSLVLGTCIGNYHFARVVADEAYQMGARYVNIYILDNELTRSRASYSSRENLRYLPNDIIERGKVEVNEKWARIRIENTEEFGVLDNLPSEPLTEINRVLSSALSFVREDVLSHRHPWLVFTYPGPNWAKKVYGLSDSASPEEVQEAYEKFEKVYLSILRMDTPDPIATWRKLGKALKERAKKLDEMKLDRLRFVSTKTKSDLSVSLAPSHIWSGGPTQLPDGRWHEPNYPTEEVFTAPDYRKTEGFIQTTRPVVIMGTVVDGAWFRFEKGKVIDCGAKKGEAILSDLLTLDDQAKYLGEVALVDLSSPIYQSGLVFNTTLFDENATCHIALGGAYPTCLSNGRALKSKEELLDAGCNVSNVHTDVMISDENTDVIGYTHDGSEIPIIRKGRFVI